MMKNILIAIFFLATSTSLISQTITNNQPIIDIYKNRKYKNPNLSHESFFKTHGNKMHLGKSKMELVKTVSSKNSWTHFKYDQFYQEIPILGKTYILHEYNRQVVASNGHFVSNITCKSKPEISIANVRKAAIKHLNTENFTIDTIKFLSIEKVIADVLFPRLSNKYVVAFSIDVLYLNEKINIIINGIDGTIIHSQSYRHYHNVIGRGKTKYYGEQEFLIDSISPEYFILFDSVRNIRTFYQNKETLEPYINESSTWNLENDQDDHVALDVHFCTSRFHDMMETTFDWKGIDGNGGAMNPIISKNNGLPQVNAFWDGKNAIFGKGDCQYGPLTSLSIVGHEFMHGVTEHTSGLFYGSEAAAINEGMSDIFGKALEYKNDKENFNWEFNPEINNSDYSRDFRSMSDPNTYECPKYYYGDFWVSNNDPHCNNGVLNYWFYILNTGWSGQNEIGEDFNIQAVSFDDALQVLFKCQTAYLTPNSNYTDLYNVSLLATEELFGVSSDQYNSINMAWKAVGLSGEVTLTDHNDLKLFNLDHDENRCLEGEMFSPKIKIQNNGTLVIETGTEIEILVLKNGLKKYNLTLTEEMPVGGSIEFTCTNAFIVDEIGDLTYNVILKYTDDFEDNNSLSLSFFNANSTITDIFLVKVLPMEVACSHFDISFNILNNSCNTIAADSKFTFTLISNNEIIETLESIITADLGSGQKRRIDLSTSTEILQQNLQVIFQYEADQNPQNDTLPVNINSIPDFDGSGILDFSDDSYLHSFVVNNADKSYLFEYQSEPVLAILGTGNSNSLMEDPIPCVGKINAFRFENNVSLQTCINSNAYSNPVLSFDLLQLREIDSYPELNEFKTMMKIHFKDKNNDLDYFISNPQSTDFETYNYPIPEDFNGLLELSFYSFENNLEIKNINLIDNIQIKDISSISEPKTEEIIVYPNPTMDIINIHTNSRIDKMEIMDLTGKRWMIDSSDARQIDISALANGIYILSIKPINKPAKHIKFVKI